MIPPSAGAPFPTPQFPPVIAGTSIDATIKNIYNAIEPWVQWGFEVAAYAVGWIPWVGWLAPQINIFYTFGEMIVRSITFNIADWLGGNVSFGQGLVNVGIQTINAFIYLANAQLAFWLPPLPPIPPLPCPRCSTLAATTLMGPTEAPGVGVENAGVLGGLLDRVLKPPHRRRRRRRCVRWHRIVGLPSQERIRRYSVTSSMFRCHRRLRRRRPKSAPCPSIVKTPFTPLNSFRGSLTSGTNIDQPTGGPLTAVTKTLGNVRNEIRTNFNATNQPETGTNNVQAQGEVRGGGAKAVNDVVNALRAGKPSKGSEEVTKASTTVSKSFGDTAKKVVKQVRQAAKDRAGDDE